MKLPNCDCPMCQDQNLNRGGVWPPIPEDYLLPPEDLERLSRLLEAIGKSVQREIEIEKQKQTETRRRYSLVFLIVFAVCALAWFTGCKRPDESASVQVPIHTDMNWKPSEEEDWIDAHFSVESDHFRLASRTEDWLCRKEGWKNREWCASLGPAQIVFGYWGKTCGWTKPEDAFDLQKARDCARKVRRACGKKYLNADFVSSCYNAGGITKRGMIYAAKVRKEFEKLRGAI